MRRRLVHWTLTGVLCALPIASWSCQGKIGGTDGTRAGGGGSGSGGTSGGGSPGQPYSAPVSFDCEAGAVPDSVPLRRLSGVQLHNTLQDLLERTLPDHAAGVMARVESSLDALPDDTRQGPEEHWGGFTRVDQRVTQEHVDRTYDIAVAVGEELTADDGRLRTIAGDCATDGDGSNDEACLDSFLESFGERALRRALTPEDITFYKRPAGSAPFTRADWGDVIALLLASPNFFYLVEHGTDTEVDGKPEVYGVSAYELASRLSYHFWQSMPDEELLSLARSGELNNPDVYEEQADRLFQHPRTRATIRQFYGEWFRRADVARLNSLTGTPAFDTLRQDLNPSSYLREAMFDEITDMAMYYTFDSEGVVEDFYRSRKAFARDQELADYYGVPVWDGSGEPPDFVEPERQGLLTRAAMTVTGTANTRPIMKGVFIRRALLCDKLPPPPANVMATAPELAGDATSREVVESLTSTGSCVSCHQKSINPLGFATENFDALGRPRSEERLIDLVSGEVQGTAPVNTQVEASIFPDDDNVVADGIELQEAMIESGKVQACFARAYFRFTFGRVEHVGRDACALDVMHEPLESGRPIADALRAAVSTEAFQQRNFGQNAGGDDE